MNTLHPDLERYRAELHAAIAADVERRRSRRRARTRLVRIGVPGLAAALGLSLTVVLTGSEAAFAGWSPAPTPASATDAATADQTCQARLATMALVPGGAPVAPWNVVATDQRGPFTLVVYGHGADAATCLSGPSVMAVSERTAGGASSSVSGTGRLEGTGTVPGVPQSWSIMNGSGGASLGSGDVTHVAELHLASAGQGPFTVVEGQLANGASAVTVVLSDGQKVEASTENGSFLAWWPGTAGATSAEITTATGTTTEPLSTPELPTPTGPGHCDSSGTPPTTGVCTGGPQGGSSTTPVGGGLG